MSRIGFVRFGSVVVCAAVLGAVALSICPSSAQAAEKAKEKEKKTQTLTFSGKQQYVHACPAGTEPAGKAPPDGTRMYCRQPVTDGYRMHGNFITWYDNGSKRVEGEFHGNKKHGIWTVYDRSGFKKYVEEYYNGKVVKKSMFNRWGEPVDDEAKKKLLEERRQAQAWKYEDDQENSKRKKKGKAYSWVKKASSQKAKGLSWVSKRKSQKNKNLTWVTK